MVELLTSIVQSSPDTGGYTLFASKMLANNEWLTTANINEFVDVTLYRLPFYPALIALTQTITQHYWMLLLVAFQFMVFVCSAFCLRLLGNVFGLSKRSIFFLLFSYTTSLPLLLCFTLLTDSIFCSLSIIIFCQLASFLATDDDRWKNLAIIAFSLLCMAFMRETALFFALSLCPLCLVFFAENKKRALWSLCMLLIIPLLVQEGLKSWNYNRTGHRVVSAGLATALVVPTIDLINLRHPRQTDTNLSGFYEQKPNLLFIDGLNAAHKKMVMQSLNVVDIQHDNQTFFYHSFLTYPKERALLFWRNLNRDMLFVGLNPFNTFQEWVDPTGENVSHLSDLCKSHHQLTISSVAHILLLNLFRLISLITCLIGFLKLTTALLSKRHTTQTKIILTLAVHAFAWIGIHALVHLELRYVMSSATLLILFGLIPLPLPLPNLCMRMKEKLCVV